jgi:hypothetical protein
MLKTEDEDEEDRGARWKDDEIEILIALRGEMDDDFKKNSKKQGVDMWHKLHARLLSQIPTLKKSPVAVKKKFNNMFKAYKENKLANNVSGESRHDCKYYDQFESWFSQTGSVLKHVSASANDLDLHVEDFVDETDLDDSLDSTRKKTSTTRASGETKFHDEALALFGKMVETSQGLLKSFNRTTDVLNNQIDRLIDKL